MKKIISLLSIVILLLYSSQMKGQITPYLEQITVNSSSISDCSTIAFGTNSTVNLSLKMRVTKSATNDVGNFATFKLYILKNGSSSPKFINGILINNSAFWNNGTLWEGVFPQTLQATDIDISGSIFYGVYEVSTDIHPNTCNYSLTKTPPPSFTLSPTILSLACGDTSSKTFTVTPANIPSGATVTYQWSFSGWDVISSTSNSRTLQPTSGTILPSNVSVIPSINGVPKPSMSCIISQEIFNPSTSEIIGSENFCPGSSSSYTISNLGANTVTWSISNPAVASLSDTSGATISLTGLSNGTVTLNASIKNACGQTAPKSKTFTIGLPSFPAESMTGESNPLTGENIYYSIPQAIGASSYNWYFDGGGILGTTINGWQINSGQGTTVINAKVGNPGSTVVVCKATNSCGNSIKYTYVNVRSVTSPCEGFKISIINPIKKGDNLVGRILPPIIDPCDALAKMLSQKDEKKEVILFDLFGKPVFSDFFFSDEFVFSNLNLPAGNYIINITLSNGITEKQTVIIE